MYVWVTKQVKLNIIYKCVGYKYPQAGWLLPLLLLLLLLLLPPAAAVLASAPLLQLSFAAAAVAVHTRRGWDESV